MVRNLSGLIYRRSPVLTVALAVISVAAPLMCSAQNNLTTTGTELRRAIAVILHETSKPATTQVHDWTPEGLCKK
jgi:hypothetical protein